MKFWTLKYPRDLAPVALYSKTPQYFGIPIAWNKNGWKDTHNIKVLRPGNISLQKIRYDKAYITILHLEFPGISGEWERITFLLEYSWEFRSNSHCGNVVNILWLTQAGTGFPRKECMTKVTTKYLLKSVSNETCHLKACLWPKRS